jgi:predicted DNA-binding transcriptional regulator YafY
MSCARVCPVEVLCVGDCVLNNMGVPPIQIGRLQRYATDIAYENGWRFFEAGDPTGKSVGLVGGGPASLAAAHALRRMGHACTLYEKRDVLGGLNTWGVAPYKLVNIKGIWYLAGRDGEKLKTFSFAKIERVRMLESRFEADPELEKKLVEEDGIWLGEERREIVLKVSAEVAGYFKRRKLIANQVIEKELEDGGLIVSAKVGHVNQVLPIVRYWIPHLRVISPEGLQEELEQELKRYVQSGRGDTAAREREGSK